MAYEFLKKLFGTQKDGEEPKASAADSIAIQREKNEAVVKSESNDGYSVSYADAGSYSAVRSEMYRTVRTYLANTGLLYRGWVKEYDDKQ